MDRIPAHVGVDAIVALHSEIARNTRRLNVLHAARLECRKGCSSCCVDGLTVFEVEAELIRARHAELLAANAPHAEGACAFLDAHGACRIYAERPYVCRTQGLPLRWIEEREGGAVELRDICPLNEAGTPVEELDADACWTLGPVEERLGQLQLAAGAGPPRIRLRDLFADASRGLTGGTRPSSDEAVISMGDKSPKAKDKAKKQHTADKDQKHAAAVQKAKPATPGAAAKKGR
jgi:hypothetical protein